MREGDVVVLPMPLSDGSIRNRPAVVLRAMPAFRDVLVCGVSTQLHQAVANFDEVIAASDPDFGASGLRADSVIRLGFLQVVPRRTIAGTIGAISVERHIRLLKTLSDYLVK
jgi:mRNA interferase MazF